jgi:protein-tyrosine-phosphatase
LPEVDGVDTLRELMRHVLVVCTANQCRSPMAEGLIRSRIEAEGLEGRVSVSSAGTWTDSGVPATQNAVAALAERGLDISSHRSREVSEDMMQGADLILVMTGSHLQALTAEFPGQSDRVRLLSSLAGGAWDIADPVGGSLDDYRVTAAEIERLIDAGWDVIVGSA